MTGRNASVRPLSVHVRVVSWAVAVGDAASLAFVAAFLLTVWEIAARFVFERPTVWTLEITLLFTGIAYLLTGPQATALDSHIRIEIVVERFSRSVRRAMRVVSAFLSACYGLVIVYSGYKLAAPLVDGVEYTGSALNSPAPTIVKVLIPFIGLGWALISVADLIRLAHSSGDSKPGIQR